MPLHTTVPGLNNYSAQASPLTERNNPWGKFATDLGLRVSTYDTKVFMRLTGFCLTIVMDISYFEEGSSFHAQIPNIRIQEVFRNPIR